MVNLFSGERSDLFFGGEVPPAVQRLLDRARRAKPADIEALLWTAHVTAPDCLPVYYLLCKHHARLRQYEQAEYSALCAIARAAAQAGLVADWTEVAASDADFTSPGPARFWLFSLKTLAFVCLRTHRPEAARAVLAKLRELDPQHGLGGEVIAALLDGSQPPSP